MGRGARALAGFALAALTLLSVAGPAGAVTGSWSDQLADLVGAGPLAGNGRGVTVAVLDTWVDVTHPDFGGRVSRGVTCTGTRCVPGADQPDTCDPHGTHVTGIIASSRYGVAPQARVVPVRVLTSASGSCTANAGDVALGIRYAIAHHIRLINVSLGSTFPLADPGRVLPAAVTAARKAGDLVIVAAGNGRAEAATTYGPDALTVAALGPDGSIASYSQRGKGVDIAAPGRRRGRRQLRPGRLRRLHLGGRRLRLGRRHLDGGAVRQRYGGPAALPGSAPNGHPGTPDHHRDGQAASRSGRGTARYPRRRPPARGRWQRHALTQ